MKEFAAVPPAESVQGQRPHHHAPQIAHRKPDGVTHTTYLTVSPFMDRHSKMRQILLVIVSGQYHHCRGRHAVLQLYAHPEQIQFLLRHNARHRHLIGLIDLMAGMGQSLSQFPIIGQQQQSFCIVVQPSHRIDPLGNILNIICNRFPPFRILHGCHHAPGLVKQQIGLALPVDGMTVHHNESIGAYFGP